MHQARIELAFRIFIQLHQERDHQTTQFWFAEGAVLQNLLRKYWAQRRRAIKLHCSIFSGVGEVLDNFGICIVAFVSG